MEYADYKVRGIPTRMQADEFLEEFRAIAKTYGHATLADLKDMCNIETSYLDNKIWWSIGDLERANVFSYSSAYGYVHGYGVDLSLCPRFVDGGFNNPVLYSKANWSEVQKQVFETLSNKKENNMNINDVKVIIGNKAYRAQTANYTQTAGDYPQIELEASLSPYNRVPTSTVRPAKPLTITNVIFNSPATIVFWSDNTKTVVKCDLSQEEYDPEKGLAMAIAKKTFGENKYEYYNVFLHWLKKYNKQLNNHE